MGLISSLKFITSHPLNRRNKLGAILRFFKWQFNTVFNPFPIIYPFTNKAKLIVGKGMTGATANLYCGLHEYSEMFFLLHLLRTKDLFVDIGANIGSYTVLASAHVSAKTISVEPVPSTFEKLLQNISVNQIGEKVEALNIALGATKGTINFTSTFDSANHVATSSDEKVIEVKLEKLDTIIKGKNPLLLKIDVEGFETEVVKGAEETLSNNTLKAIIIELNGSGKRYGYNEDDIHKKLLKLSFNPYTYDPIRRLINKAELSSNDNTIYIRDIPFVEERLQTAAKVKIINQSI